MTAIRESPTALSGKPTPPAASGPPPEPPPTLDLTGLVQTHQAGVWRYLRYLGANLVEADDLTQETFLSVARKLERDGGFEQRSEPQTAGYLRAAARNQLLMLRRREKRQVQTVALETAESVWSEQADDRGWRSILESLGECVEKLAGRPREAIDLQYIHGAGRAEIATQLSMTQDGVKTLLRRARKLLRECVERSK